MRFNKEWFAIGVIIGLCMSVMAWAATTDQIWQDIYDATNHYIRVHNIP